MIFDSAPKLFSNGIRQIVMYGESRKRVKDPPLPYFLECKRDLIFYVMKLCWNKLECLFLQRIVSFVNHFMWSTYYFSHIQGRP